MNRTGIRSILTLSALSALVVILAACGTTTGSPTSEAPSTPAAPSQAPESEAPSQAPESEAPSMPGTPVPAGTLTVADGMVVDGPGVSLSDALDGDLSQPVLVRGALFLDEDGTVWLADSIVDASGPTFSDLRVMVANYPTDGPTWDTADAEITGLQEVNGIRFYEDTKLYGTITP